jgi:hypothetical protein
VDVPKVRWRTDPEDHDYPAAQAYLCLIVADEIARRLALALRSAPATTQKAKDILRASRLDLLPSTNPHVAADLAKIAAKTPLSPILLIRGDAAADRPAQIADGYHRVCASYYTDENTDIPCRLVDLDANLS